MKILFICSYPNYYFTSNSIFVYRLIQTLIELGCEVVVIAPQNWRAKRKSFYEVPGNKEYGLEGAKVYRPKYFDFPNRVKLGGFSAGRLNALFYKLAVKRVLSKIDFTPDIVYSHFLYRGGPAALYAAQYFEVPAVVALGESSMEKHEPIFTRNKMANVANKFDAIISVSEKNKNYCINKLGVAENKITVVPNAVDTDIFYRRNKQEMRNKYGLPQDKFIVAFTGHYIERKGPLRLLAAIDKIAPEKNVGGLFIGSGEQEPFGEHVLFKGRLIHTQVPEMLSAADVFVLPTLNEGSCNAIAEAMACGLPIISSDIEAIREQVTQDNAVLVNPLNVTEIQQAIEKLADDAALRESMSHVSLLISSENTALERAKTIKLTLEHLL